MTPQQKQEIIAYLKGPRIYSEGVALYKKFGANLRLKREFSVEETSSLREILFEELRKLSGLTPVEFARLPRVLSGKKVACVIVDEPKKAESPAPDDDRLLELAESLGVSVDELLSDEFADRVQQMAWTEEDNEEKEARIEELEDEIQEIRSKYAEAPEPVKKMIRFRERYPFLNSEDCPDILKILVADMFTAYGKYREAHARLAADNSADAIAAADDCRTVVEEYLKNREIWDELNYYKENGKILGKAAKLREAPDPEDFTALSDVDLMGKLKSAQVQESKRRARIVSAMERGEVDEKEKEALEMWTSRKNRLKEELDRRKKK